MSLTGALLVGGLGAACGGDASGQEAAEPAERGPSDFCTGAKALYEQFTQANVSDPAGPEARQVFAEAQQLEPPAAIAEPWEQSLALLEPLVGGEIDTSDPAQVAQLGAQAAQIDGESLEAYFAEECPIDSSPSTSSTVAAAG